MWYLVGKQLLLCFITYTISYLTIVPRLLVQHVVKLYFILRLVSE
jgi:hypothetical protein